MRASQRPILVIVCCLLVAVLTSCSGGSAPAGQTATSAPPAAPADVPSASAAPPPAPPSDEDEARDALLAMTDAYNTQNWDAYLELMCPDVRAKYTGQLMNSVKNTRAQNGLSFMKVVDVKIDGDTAKVTVEASNEVLGSKTLTMPMERSDGWKLCARDGVT